MAVGWVFFQDLVRPTSQLSLIQLAHESTCCGADNSTALLGMARVTQSGYSDAI